MLLAGLAEFEERAEAAGRIIPGDLATGLRDDAAVRGNFDLARSTCAWQQPVGLIRFSASSVAEGASCGVIVI